MVRALTWETQVRSLLCLIGILRDLNLGVPRLWGEPAQLD